jgi:molybdopterin-guanine dinucleotide biosynthesis protein A
VTSGTIAGAILAGGRSSRMGGCDKAFAALAGKPLLARVIERVQPQAQALALCVATASRDIEAFGLQQLTDPAPGHQGPLGGLLSALRHFSTSHHWLFLAPCDAPFLPLNLAVMLRECATIAGAPCAAVVYEDELQPTFSIWHSEVLQTLERAVGQADLAGFKQFMGLIKTAELNWPTAEPPPFFNVNDRAALEQADRWIRQDARLAQAC